MRVETGKLVELRQLSKGQSFGLLLICIYYMYILYFWSAPENAVLRSWEAGNSNLRREKKKNICSTLFFQAFLFVCFCFVLFLNDFSKKEGSRAYLYCLLLYSKSGNPFSKPAN